MELTPGLYQPRQFMQQTSEQASSKPLPFPPLFGDLLGQWDVKALKPSQSQVLCWTLERGSALQFQQFLFSSVKLIIWRQLTLPFLSLFICKLPAVQGVLWRLCTFFHFTNQHGAGAWQRHNKYERIFSSLLYLRRQFNLTSIYWMCKTQPALWGKQW